VVANDGFYSLEWTPPIAKRIWWKSPFDERALQRLYQVSISMHIVWGIHSFLFRGSVSGYGTSVSVHW
jgi:hypothetical protein